MRDSLCDVWIHAVWGTWDRQPMLVDSIIEQVHGAIATKCRELKCAPIAVGGIADHVHLLALLHPMVPVARLVQEVKGSSSHFATHAHHRPGLFKWQGAYAAFSVSKGALEEVRNYVLNQAVHHGRRQAIDEWELQVENAAAEALGVCGMPPRLRR